ncbi:30S ribosomal protein S3 [Candidatus Microgenomates bacterium]|nr:30S ribosomal protein S3 [Candidatus Microgenomates bacterium]
MGNKIHPIGFRLGPVYTWTARWFANRDRYADLLLQDVKLRKALMLKLKPAGIARVEIERSINKLGIIIYVSRPGVVIGRGGTGLEDLKKYITKDLLKIKDNDKNAAKVDLKVEAIREPNLNAHLVGMNICEQLLKRMPPKRVLKQTVEKVMSAGARGVRVRLGGRINGAEIARVEHVQAGVLPFSSIREKIDFAVTPALTRSGYVGVKVWICLPEEKKEENN